MSDGCGDRSRGRKLLCVQFSMQIALFQLPSSFLLLCGPPKAGLEDSQGPVFADASVPQRKSRPALCRNQEYQTRRNRAERIAFDHGPFAIHRAGLRRLPAGIEMTKKNETWSCLCKSVGRVQAPCEEKEEGKCRNASLRDSLTQKHLNCAVFMSSRRH